jgi:hypothetical protein
MNERKGTDNISFIPKGIMKTLIILLMLKCVAIAVAGIGLCHASIIYWARCGTLSRAQMLRYETIVVTVI